MSAFDTTLTNLGISRSATPGPTVTTAAAAQSLDQSDFLALLTAQMKNQDPFEPVDNTQMVAQMAQFSSLAGISEMSSTLKSLAEKLGGTSTADALAYVGRTVLTEGTTAYPRASGGIAGAIELSGAASDVDVRISNADGTLLRTLELGASGAGTVDYDWDGTTDSGAAAGDGPFTVSVTARSNGAAVSATNLVWAPVQSVSTAGGTARLSLPGIGDVPTTAVRRVG